jgi:hypothetical protein
MLNQIRLFDRQTSQDSVQRKAKIKRELDKCRYNLGRNRNRIVLVLNGMSSTQTADCRLLLIQSQQNVALQKRHFGFELEQIQIGRRTLGRGLERRSSDFERVFIALHLKQQLSQVEAQIVTSTRLDRRLQVRDRLLVQMRFDVRLTYLSSQERVFRVLLQCTFIDFDRFVRLQARRQA